MKDELLFLSKNHIGVRGFELPDLKLLVDAVFAKKTFEMYDGADVEVALDVLQNY